MENKAENKSAQIFVNPSTVLGSAFAQIVFVSVTSDSTVTLDFIYKHPKDPNEGQVVTRVTLPVAVAKDLSDVINKTILKSENKHNGSTKNANKSK